MALSFLIGIVLQLSTFAQPSIIAHHKSIQELFDSSGIVGMGAVLIVDQKVVWSGGWGWMNLEEKIPFTEHTIMNAGSIAKTFTATCIMKAVENGLLNLDTDINQYLPFTITNPYQPDKKITLRHLLSHTSGITDRRPYYGNTYIDNKDPDIDLETSVKNYFIKDAKDYDSSNFLNKTPGTFRDYSNMGFALAGYILEKRVSMSLPEYSKRNIFDKLGMTESAWYLRDTDMKKHTRLYDRENGPLKQIPLYTFPTYPEGGLRTSPAELSRFFIAMLNDGVYEGISILSKSSIDQMITKQHTPENCPENVNLAKANSGLGWAYKDNATKMGHAGTDPGIKTEMLCDLDKEIAVVLFTNTGLPMRELIKYHFGIFDELMAMGKTYQQLARKK